MTDSKRPDSVIPLFSIPLTKRSSICRLEELAVLGSEVRLGIGVLLGLPRLVMVSHDIKGLNFSSVSSLELEISEFPMLSSNNEVESMHGKFAFFLSCSFQTWQVSPTGETFAEKQDGRAASPKVFHCKTRVIWPPMVKIRDESLWVSNRLTISTGKIQKLPSTSPRLSSSSCTPNVLSCVVPG